MKETKKRVSSEWEKIIAKETTDKELISKIYKQFLQLSLKKNTFESVLMSWTELEPIIQSEVSQEENHQYSILMHIYGI